MKTVTNLIYLVALLLGPLANAGTLSEELDILERHIRQLNKDRDELLEKYEEAQEETRKALDVAQVALDQRDALAAERDRLIAMLAEEKTILYRWTGRNQTFSTAPFYIPEPRDGFSVKWIIKDDPEELFHAIKINVYDASDNRLVDSFSQSGAGHHFSWINESGKSYYLKIAADSEYEVAIETSQ